MKFSISFLFVFSLLWICTIHGQTVNTEQVLDSSRLATVCIKLPRITEKALQIKKLHEALIGFERLNSKEYVQESFPTVVLKKGDSNTHVFSLKRRLKFLELYTQDSVTSTFDDSLENSVKIFQQIHNLTADGIVGKNTCQYLNLTLNYYIKTLKTNILRYEQLPDSLPQNRIEINTPEYALRYYHNGDQVQQLEVIVGKYDTKTPELNSEITYLVFNPCWTIPHSIAVKKILPRLKRDSMYLDNHNMFVCIDGITQNHRNLDFAQCSETNFPYKIFQNASAANALGRVKFMFENAYSVYLHDTPSKYLFNKDFRNFSNGCVRVNQALELAEMVLDNDENSAKIKDKLAPGYPVKVYLNTPIPIVMQYFTARYNAQLNKVQFYRDSYYKDRYYRD